MKRTSPSCLGELMLKRGGVLAGGFAGLGVDAVGEGVHLDGEARGHGGEDAGVDADAGLLHAQEDGDQREVHGLVDVLERRGLEGP